MVAIVPQPAFNAKALLRGNAIKIGGAALATAACGGALAVLVKKRKGPASIRRDALAFRERVTDPAMKDFRQMIAMNNTIVDCICGSLGEVAALLSFFPLDTLKVHCQAHSIGMREALRRVLSDGTLHACKRLYSGVGTAAIGAAIVGAVHLSVYHYWKRLELKIRSAESSQCSSASAKTGLLAVWGAVVSSMTVGALEAPLDQVKLRMQANTIRGPPLLHLLETLSSAGARQMFISSFVPFVLKAIPHDVGEFVTFGTLSESGRINTVLAPLSENGRDALIGAAAGCTAALLSNPFDVVCTKVQTSPVPPHGNCHSLRSSLAAFMDTARAEFAVGGMRRMYAGFVPRLLQMVPASVVYWLVVEEARRRIQRVDRPDS